MNHSLGDLLDVPRLASLLETLYQATGLPSAVIDLEGRVLTGAGWQAICVEFYRKHPEGLQQCIGSDTRIAAELNTTRGVVCYECPHGLVD